MPNILEIIIAGNFSQLTKALSGAEKSTSSFQKGLNVASVAAGGALLALGAAAKVGFDEFNQGQKVAAQTNAVLKSTGGAAGVTAKHVEALGRALLHKSGVDDEVIKSGENVLLSFTRIHNEAGKGPKIFDRATRAALDFSVRTGTDMPQAAKLLGKALNDPIGGLGALAKAGVKFTDEQKAAMKAMVDSGNTAGAQGVILKALETRFGGAAEDAGKTFAGKMRIAKEESKNVAGEIAGDTSPALDVLRSALGAATGFMRDHTTTTRIAVGVVAGLSAAVLAVNLAMRASAAVTAAASAAKAWFVTMTVEATVATEGLTAAQVGLDAAMAANPFGLVIVGLAAVGAAFIIAWKKSEAFRAAMQATKQWIADHWPVIAAIISGPFAPLVALATNAFGIRSALIHAFETVKDFIHDTIASIPGMIRGFLGAVGGAAVDLGERVLHGIGQGLANLASKLVGWIKAPINAVLSAVNHVTGRINSALEFSVDTHIPGVGKVGFDAPDIPSIPYLAAGGIVTRPTLAWVGESGPEAVIPLSGSGAGGGGGGGGNVYITVHGWVGDERALVERLRAEFIRAGRRMPGVLGGLG